MSENNAKKIIDNVVNNVKELNQELNESSQELGDKATKVAKEFSGEVKIMKGKVKDSVAEKCLDLKSQLGDNVDKIKEKTAECIDDGVKQIKKVTKTCCTKSCNCTNEVIEYTKERPLKALGIAVVVGVVVGKLFFGSKKKK